MQPTAPGSQALHQPPAAVLPASATVNGDLLTTTGASKIMSKTTKSLFLIGSFSEQDNASFRLLGRAGPILSFHATVEATTHYLIRQAEIAHGSRRLDRLEAIARQLIKLPYAEAQAAALFYFGLCARRRNSISEARFLYEQAAACDSPKFRARAIQAIGALMHESGNIAQALPLFVEAARIAQEADPLTFFNASLEVSAFKSAHGEHRQALEDLEKLYPLAKMVSFDHPHLWPLYHNEAAYESLQLGQVERAQALSRIAISSPIARAYPEWLDTNHQIVERATAPVIIVVPDLSPEPLKQELPQLPSDSATCGVDQTDLQPALNSRDALHPSPTVSRAEIRAGPRAPPSSAF